MSSMVWTIERFIAYGKKDGSAATASVERSIDGKYRFCLRSDKSKSGWGRVHGGYSSLERAMAAAEYAYERDIK